MLLSEKKEREYRFKLALRMGLPIFGLLLVLIFSTLINSFTNLNVPFVIGSVILVFISVYFIFYLIYNGFNEQITDTTSKVFTREYFYNFIEEEIKKHPSYTLILVSVTNIYDINSQYGLKNGDKVLEKVAFWLGDFLASKNLHDIPIGRIKGGDFVIGLNGDLNEHKVLLELLEIKGDDFKVDDIEVDLIATGIDTSFSKKVDHLFDALYYQLDDCIIKGKTDQDYIDPNELELLVIDAIKSSSISIATQQVFDKDKNYQFDEVYIRLKAKNGKYIHQKKYTKVINKLGLGLEFDKMILKEIFSKITIKNIKVVIPIATSSIRNIEFLKYLKFLAKQNPNTAQKIMFLFSENEYYGKMDRFNMIINSYKEVGVSFVLDKLGSLHTSFLYLRDLDVDIIRFCSSYTKGEKVFEYQDVIEGFAAIIKKKKKKSWVKMIETKQQYEVAKELGIDYFEGKYLATIQEENL